MSFSISFLPQVEDDAIEAYTWYEGQAKGLGEEFLRVFYAASTHISRNPLIYQIVYKNFRRALLRRFPYALYFLVREEDIIIYGLFHCARDPRFHKTELKKRKKENH
jgi:plasmid stabilization system protein ParE